ncbi:hypothetical protein [Prauserella alba]|uniref:hypothetical protein n=1 Tax=Prauserella alba TaxID=176898 RepID=UPI0020A5FAD0|nr:hypothetical protein [Prauserella alba]
MMVFTTCLSGGRGGRNHLDYELRRHDIGDQSFPVAPSRHLRQGRTVPAELEN